MEITSRNIMRLEKRIAEKEAVIESYAKTITKVKTDNFNIMNENIHLNNENVRVGKLNKGLVARIMILSKSSSRNRSCYIYSACLNVCAVVVIALILTSK